MSVLFLSVHQTNQVTRKLQWTISSVFFSLSLRWAVKEAGGDVPSTPTPSLFSFPDFHLVFRKFSQLLSSFPLVREILSAVKMAAAAWGIFSFWQTPIHPPLSSSFSLLESYFLRRGQWWPEIFTTHSTLHKYCRSKQEINPPPSLRSHSAWCCISLRRFCLY